MYSYVFFMVFGLPCILTVIIELIVFALFSYAKKGYFIRLLIFTNIFTNISLNFIFYFLIERIYNNFIYLILIILEMLVVFIEYKIYAATEKSSEKLLGTTITANVLSFILGYFIFLNVFELI